MSINSPVKQFILVADDDVGINHLLVNTLLSKFDVDSSYSGAETLVKCRQKVPDMILLDVNLGDADGRDVCQELREDLGNDCPLIVFISSDQAHKNIVSCFEHGADDFIGKPFSPTQVIAKVNALLKYSVTVSKVTDASADVITNTNGNTATSATQLAQDFSDALDLIPEVIACYSEEALADVTLQFIEQHGYSSAIYFTFGNQSFCYDSQARVCSPIVKELFEITVNKQPYLKLGNRALFAQSNCSLLIKNPPFNDEQKLKQFKAVIEKLLQTVAARFESILRERDIFSVNGEVVNVLGEVSEDLEALRAHKQAIMNLVIRKLSESFDLLDLKQFQEDYFVELLDETLSAHDDNNLKIMSLQDRINLLHSELKSLIKQ
jgi:CheY-like chemotaxis protein